MSRPESIEHPRTGGRVLLDLDPPGEAGAVRYRAALYTPEVCHRGAAEISVAGQVAFAGWDPPDPPDWLVGFAQAFLRSEWRARQGVADPAPWPSRIRRWRDRPG